MQTDATVGRQLPTFRLYVAKSLTGFKLWATTCNRVYKRTQHVTSNKVGSCWPTMLRPFARGFRGRGRECMTRNFPCPFWSRLASLTTWQGWNNRDETVWKNANSPFDNVFAEPSQNDKILTKDEENLESTTKAERNWGRTLELLKWIFLPQVFYFNVINQDSAVSDFAAETASAMFASKVFIKSLENNITFCQNNICFEIVKRTM